MKTAVVTLLFALIAYVGIDNSLFGSTEALLQEEATMSFHPSEMIDSVQVLLTNHFKLNDSETSGASAFLVEAKNDTLICTAKHLLGNAMGIEPEVDPSDFDSALVFWSVFTRANTLSDEELSVTRIITKKKNRLDAILLDYEPKDSLSLEVLKPRLTRVKKGETLYLIGCEYADQDCHQNLYALTFDEYLFGELYMTPEESFDLSGFSGAPVLDSNGYVVGVLSGGGESAGKTFLAAAPISGLKNYLE